MGSTPLFTTYRMELGEGLWLCDPSSQGPQLDLHTKGLRILDLQAKGGRGKLVLWGEIQDANRYN